MPIVFDPIAAKLLLTALVVGIIIGMYIVLRE